MIPAPALPQFLSDLTHASVILCVVICATVLSALHVLDSATTGNVYTAAVGYAAGRAGSVSLRQFQVRNGERAQ